MFVINTGVAQLHKYDIGETLSCKVIRHLSWVVDDSSSPFTSLQELASQWWMSNYDRAQCTDFSWVQFRLHINFPGQNNRARHILRI